MNKSESQRLNKDGVYTLALVLIYSGIKKNETDFLSCSTYGAGLLSYAEERLGVSYREMEKAVKNKFSTKNLDLEVFKKEAESKPLSELAIKYNCSQQLLRSYCVNHQINFIKQRETTQKQLNDELIMKLQSFNGRYSVYEMAQMTHRCTTTIKALCKAYNIPKREA